MSGHSFKITSLVAAGSALIFALQTTGGTAHPRSSFPSMHNSACAAEIPDRARGLQVPDRCTTWTDPGQSHSSLNGNRRLCKDTRYPGEHHRTGTMGESRESGGRALAAYANRALEAAGRPGADRSLAAISGPGHWKIPSIHNGRVPHVSDGAGGIQRRRETLTVRSPQTTNC